MYQYLQISLFCGLAAKLQMESNISGKKIIVFVFGRTESRKCENEGTFGLTLGVHAI